MSYMITNEEIDAAIKILNMVLLEHGVSPDDRKCFTRQMKYYGELKHWVNNLSTQTSPQQDYDRAMKGIK